VDLPVYSADDFIAGGRRHLSSFDAAIGTRFRPDPDIGYVMELSPEGRFGFQNGAEYDGAAGPNVVVVGDSIISFGSLAAALKSLLPGVKVWNIGVPGYNTTQEWLYLTRKTTVVPDLIVLGFCINDFDPSIAIADGRFRTNRYEPLGTVSPFWFRHSMLYRLAAVTLIRRRQQANEEQLPVRRQEVRTALLRFQEHARARHAGLLVLVYPLMTDKMPDKARRSYDLAVELLRELQIPFVDLDGVFTGDRLALRNSPDDDLHPNAAAQLLAAKAALAAFPALFQLRR
jgi:lysophospholipase L1-like esterase